jgi:hypothetical protein
LKFLFLGEKAKQLLAYEGLPAAADFLFQKSPNIAKNHQILPKLAVSQQNKTYVVTLMLRVVVGAVSQTRTILIIDLTSFSIRNPRCQSDSA